MELGLIAGATFSCKEQNFPNGCHICELEIDPETGEVEILRYSVVDDVGTVMNPLLLEGQIRGGIAQGVGQMLMEDIRFDPASGQLLTGSFMDYAMPRAGDLSAVHCESNPVPTKTNPLGRQGRGRSRQCRRAARRRQRARRRAVPARHPPHRDARHPRTPVAGDAKPLSAGSIPMIPCIVQNALVVLTTIEDSDDDNLGFRHLKDDRYPALEAYYPQTGANIVPPPAALGKGREREALRLDAIDISPGNRATSLFGDMAVERKQISFSARTEVDVILLHSPLPPRPRRSALSGA